VWVRVPGEEKNCHPGLKKKKSKRKAWKPGACSHGKYYGSKLKTKQTGKGGKENIEEDLAGQGSSLAETYGRCVEDSLEREEKKVCEPGGTFKHSKDSKGSSMTSQSTKKWESSAIASKGMHAGQSQAGIPAKNLNWGKEDVNLVQEDVGPAQ